MATAYPTTLKYDQSSKATYQVRSIQSGFGDGYQEVTPDGINHIVQSGTLVHQLMGIADAVTLRNFLKSYCGTNTVVQIKNMMEDPTGTATLDVYLTSWSESYTGVYFTFTVGYRESFNG